VANILKKPTRHIGKIIKTIAAVAVLGTCMSAQAAVLDFENLTPASPFTTHGVAYNTGKFWIETYAGETAGLPAQAGDLAGAFINGSTNATCFLECPVNNQSTYYSGLADGYFYFGMGDDSLFNLKSLQASFMGSGQDSYPDTAGLLVLQGFDATGNLKGNALQIGLDGPAGDGNFYFGNYELGSWGRQNFAFVRVLGYACDATLNCNRSMNLSNFAIDNIETIPEPTSIALIGLGLFGMLALSRRRSV